MKKRIGDIEIEYFEDSEVVLVHKHVNSSIYDTIRLEKPEDLGDLQYAISCAITLISRLDQRR